MYEENEVMQYTGFKDNNNQEIFEDDIVRLYGGECYYGQYEIDLVVKIADIRVWFNDLYNAENIEILGNEYEHPYLLDQLED